MRILIDTNILIDFLMKRPLFYDDARKVIQLCMNKKIEGCIAAHSVMNIFYILRKDFTVDERRNILSDFCRILTVVGIDKTKLLSSFGNFDFTDIEDCLQMECAKEFSADYIVTRNIKDFQNSVIQPIMPDEFLKMV